MLKDESETLREAFVAAYPVYVVRVLAQRGVEMNEVLADAVIEGTSVLDGLLRHLANTPVIEQRSSPLELFREALRPIDRALDVVDAPAPPSGSGVHRIAPWDRYALSPGSSQVLGPSAHEAHLAWGVAKARAVAWTVDTTQGPALGLFCPADDRAILVAYGEASGYRTVVLPSNAPVAVAIVCADDAGADDIVRASTAESRVVVYGRSLDDIDQIRFRSLGAATVVSADAFLKSPGDYLPKLA